MRMKAVIFVGFVGLVVEAIAADDTVWNCEAATTETARLHCAKARDAKPFRYRIEPALPGKGYALCDLMLANMRAQPEPMSCNLQIAPQFKKYFSLPEWEELDPWADVDLLREIDVTGAAVHPQREELAKLTREHWLEHFTQRLQKNNQTPVIHRTAFDLDGDGKADVVLGYQLRSNEPCNPWALSRMYGYSLFIRDDNGRLVPASLIGFDMPFFYSGRDPRYPRSHTYRFRFNGVGRGGIAIDPGAGGTACLYDFLKQQPDQLN